MCGWICCNEAPASGPYFHWEVQRRILHGKTQMLTNWRVPIKIQSHARASERAGSPVHHQHVGQKRGTREGHHSHGAHLGPPLMELFLIFEQTGALVYFWVLF